MRSFRVIVGRRVGPFWVGVSARPGGRHRRPPPPKWAFITGLVVGAVFFVCFLAVVFG